jgi:hypothetical protein
MRTRPGRDVALIEALLKLSSIGTLHWLFQALHD